MTNRSFALPLLTAGLLLAVAPVFAASAAGPEPYSAADPVYAPMTKEPVMAITAPAKASLGDTDSIKGPDAGPQPYAAADPVYPTGK